MSRVSGVMVLSLFGLMLAGCSSGSVGGGFPGMASSNPEKTTIQLQSEPAGAQAKTSLGSSCQTPCSLELAASSDISVTFSLDGYQPQTISLKPAAATGPGAPGTVVLTPNPVMAQLEPVMPAAKKKPKPRKHVAAAKPKPPAAQPTQPETPPSQSPPNQ